MATPVTRLISDADAGDDAARSSLFDAVYDELRRIAHGHLSRHQATLCTTALVHEAYIKLIDRDAPELKNRAYFFASAARAMRQILVDYARHRTAQKRGGKDSPISLEGVEVAAETCADEILALDEALTRLAAFDARLAQVVECRFFGGLSVGETSAVMETSERTVKRDWRRARAWLYREMQGADLPQA